MMPASRNILILAILSSAAAIAQSATAQTMEDDVVLTGSRIVEDPDRIETDVVRVMQKKMARCVYSKRSNIAVKLLESSDQASIDYDKLGFTEAEFVQKFGLALCLGQATTRRQYRAEFRFQPVLLRSLLAEEVYLANQKQALELPEGSEESMSTRFFVPSENIEQARAFGAFTDCIVYNAPADADALLRTRPASAQELEAVMALVPAVSSCLYEGQEFTLTAHGARTLVSDGLWSRMHYPAKAPSAIASSSDATSN